MTNSICVQCSRMRLESSCIFQIINKSHQEAKTNNPSESVGSSWRHSSLKLQETLCHLVNTDVLCWLQQQDGRLRITYSGHVHQNEAACHQWSWITLQQQVNDHLPLSWWLTQDLMINSRCCYVLLLHQSWTEQKQYKSIVMCVFIVRFYFSTSEYILLQHLQHQMIPWIRLQDITE